MAQNDFNPTPPPEPHVAAEPITEDLVQDKEEEDDSSKIVIPVPESESLSLKEDSNRVSDSEKNAIDELKKLLKEELEDEEVSIWGVPLFKDDRTDVILLKFLRARELKVKDALVMFQNTLRWRKDFNIDALLDEDLGDHLEKVVFMHGHGREGHPVCYNVYGEFQNKDLYHKASSSQDNRNKFLRWRIQLLERSIRHLDFTPSSGINTIFQVNDLKNSPGPAKRELRLATKQALQLLQDNYPEFVAKQVFINVPWWYLAFYTMINPFLTSRTKSKFVFAGPSKSPDTLFKYISPEQVPVQYGGLSVDFCDCNPDFTMSDPVTEIPIKPTTKQTVEIAIYEKCIIVWELRVVGWEVSYNAEFKPDVEDAYTVIIQKATKMSPTDEPVVSNSFKVVELGKLLLTIDNPTLKKKRLLYRFKIKPYSD
ncbi:patellin-3-like [Glycine max]|uniref:CRAL-TRIO domain-containing protein n=1 Tax=Glycine max TaxID=3847 RepID=C6TJ77_SOYBN|nr:patellin-3-like [Glycine max]ACU22967.1 unknown [Glycine max]|eukprot:NP_001276245.1 patellin-3-like [Glycine max]